MAAMWLVNAGGSSLKVRFGGTIEVRCIGLRRQELVVSHPNCHVRECEANTPELAAELVCAEAGKMIAQYGLPLPTCVGHRVKFAGMLTGAVQFDDAVMRRVEDDAYLNVQHARQCLAMRRAMDRYWPGIEHIAVFDHGVFSGLHETNLPLPSWAVRRYEILQAGHHGLACRSVLDALNIDAHHQQRSLIIHIGSGASVSAFIGRKPVYTTMLFSAYEGPIMNNRSGDVPVGIGLRLMRNGCSVQSLSGIVGEESGIYGLTGQSPHDEMRVQELIEHMSADLKTHYLHSYLDKIRCALLRIGCPDRIVFSGGVAGGVLNLLSEILNRLPEMHTGMVWEKRTALAVERINDGAVPVYFVKVDEFDAMERTILESYVQDRGPILHGTCLCPGIGGGTIEAQPDAWKTGTVAVAKKITPQFVLMAKHCSALIVEEGDATYHGAAIARELNIPCLSNIRLSDISNLSNLKRITVTVDASAGEIWMKN